MENILKELKDRRNKNNKVFGPFLNKIKNDKKWVSYIENRTKFLDVIYNNITLAQRFYHMWFNIDHIETCSVCEKSLQFSLYSRFSADKIKKYSNYIQTCSSVRCLINTEKLKGIRTGKGYASLIIKIEKNEILHKDIIKETTFLDEHYKDISISQRFYHLYFGVGLEKCPHCNGYRKFSYKNQFSINPNGPRETNYQKSCGGKECSILANVECAKKGLMEKHGVTSHWDIPGYKENFEENMLKKYGTKYMFGSKHFKKKTLEKIEKIGVGYIQQNTKVCKTKRKKQT